jgi:threonine dehydrogenase-like Zn-dependent dehydrogenase
MKAITIKPKNAATAHLEDIPEPDVRGGSVLVEAIAVGVCGTDVEIVGGKYGWAPPGQTRLVLGHESLGRVVDPGPSGGLKKGDLVVGIVRRPVLP